jgi:hypothetical protein
MKPGSPDALKAGCTCCPVENNDGAGCNSTNDQRQFTAWIIMIGCPVHDKESENGSGRHPMSSEPFEVGFVKAGLIKMMWLQCGTIWRTWRHLRAQGVPADHWYSVYSTGTEIVLAQTGAGPMAHKRASMIVDAMLATETPNA